MRPDMAANEKGVCNDQKPSTSSDAESKSGPLQRGIPISIEGITWTVELLKKADPSLDIFVMPEVSAILVRTEEAKAGDIDLWHGFVVKSTTSPEWRKGKGELQPVYRFSSWPKSTEHAYSAIAVCKRTETVFVLSAQDTPGAGGGKFKTISPKDRWLYRHRVDARRPADLRKKVNDLLSSPECVYHPAHWFLEDGSWNDAVASKRRVLLGQLLRIPAFKRIRFVPGIEQPSNAKLDDNLLLIRSAALKGKTRVRHLTLPRSFGKTKYVVMIIENLQDSRRLDQVAVIPSCFLLASGMLKEDTMSTGYIVTKLPLTLENRARLQEFTVDIDWGDLESSTPQIEKLFNGR